MFGEYLLFQKFNSYTIKTKSRKEIIEHHKIIETYTLYASTGRSRYSEIETQHGNEEIDP